MVMIDFNIDFKSKKDSNIEKLTNICATLSLANLVEGHNCFTKTHKSSFHNLHSN